ncbi:MAG: hypothetical protein MJZ59_01355 [Paludibacteraceae bacterium]|nr:hypothetical protein [Paludibacteraceae bacterium]
MKKIFSFVIVAFAAIALNAADVVFDFTNPAGLNPAVTPSTTKSTGVVISGTTFTSGDISIAFGEKVGSNGAKEFTNSDAKTYELRVYKDNAFTVSSKGDKISKIQFAFTEKGGIAPATGTIDGTGAWTGDATSITFNFTATSKIKTITVYTGEAPVITIDTLNVAEMIALIPKTPGQKLSKMACVIGRVSGLSTSGIATYGNINVWLADINNTADTIEAYAMLNYNGVKYNDAEEVQFGMGDTIVVYSNSWEYFKDEKNEQYEASKGCSLAKVVGPGHPKPIVIEEKTVAEAIEIGEGLAAGAKTPDKYDVRGYVVSISGTQGLNKLYLADDVDAFGAFVAYQSEIPEGANVVEGSFVSVVGYIEKFQFEGSTDYTIEISKGKLTVLEDPSALPNVIAEKVSCKKMMINGQMYIKNGKKLYNVLGQAL